MIYKPSFFDSTALSKLALIFSQNISASSSLHKVYILGSKFSWRKQEYLISIGESTAEWLLFDDCTKSTIKFSYLSYLSYLSYFSDFSYLSSLVMREGNVYLCLTI